MKRYWVSALIIAGLVLLSFLLVEKMGVELLTEPAVQMSKGKVWTIVIGGGLLVADVFIPVPSSVVMIAHGSLLGLWLGFLVSFLASVAGALLGWYIGRTCEGWVLRNVPEVERARAHRLFETHGLVAIVISRLLPIVSETVSIMSGLCGMDWKKVMMASALGSIPPAFIYALAGALGQDLVSGMWVAVCVFAIAVVSWVVSRKIGTTSPLRETD